MSLINKYFEQINSILSKVVESQLPQIEQASRIIANSIMNDGWLYVFGSGHSHMVAEEFFYRAGGIVRVYPILDTTLMLHEGAVKSSAIERLSGYAKSLLDDYPVKENDVIIIASNSGRNAVPIEMAIEAKLRNMKVIAITNLEHSTTVNSRHKSGKRLFELADVVIDNCGQFGDACIDINGRKIAPTSTVICSAIVNSIVAGIAEEFSNKNFSGEFFTSSNTDEGEQKNISHIKKYKNFVRQL